MNYWKRFPGDYGRDTSHLTIAQHGAYALLLDVYYSTEKPLPADISVLSRICRATTPDEQAAVKAVAEEFFPIGDDGKRHNGRADRQLEKDRAFAESQAQKARLPRKNSQKLAGANPRLSPGCSPDEHQLSPPVPVPVPVPDPPPNPSPTPKPPQEKEMDTSGLNPVPSRRDSTTRTTKNAYPPDFEQAWSAYPKRAGGNSKAMAFKAWKARIKSGIDPGTMLLGVMRYAAYIDMTGKVGTEYVQQAATFFGPAEHFNEPWDPPQQINKQAAVESSNRAALEAFSRAQGVYL